HRVNCKHMDAEVVRIAGFTCALAVALSLTILIGAVLLRGAIALYNIMAGVRGTSFSVPEPSFINSLAIILVTTTVNLAIGYFVIGEQVAAAARALQVSQAELVLRSFLLPFCLMVTAAMLAAFTPTNFGKAVFVSFCYPLLCCLISSVLLVVL